MIFNLLAILMQILQVIDDKKSTGGNLFLSGGIVVSWLIKKQACIAKSTMDAKHISYSMAVSIVV